MIAQLEMILLLLALIIGFIVLCTYCYCSFLRHNRGQSARISRLEGVVEELWERLRRQQEYYNYNIEWTDDGFNFFAMGNSLTLITSWGRGICSTKPDNDYFGLLLDYLKTKTEDVVAHRWNYAIWERAQDRSSVLDLLDPFLSDKLNLVVIQLGENVLITSEAEVERYEKDLGLLIDYVRSKTSPKTQLIVVDDFWDQERSKARKRVAAKGCLFADLAEIRGKKEYQSREGTECLMLDGKKARVSKEAETHPGDEGMAFIARRIIEDVKI